MPTFKRPFGYPWTTSNLDLVPKVGLEPTQLAPPPPQDGVSTNSTTSAIFYIGRITRYLGASGTSDLGSAFLVAGADVSFCCAGACCIAGSTVTLSGRICFAPNTVRLKLKIKNTVARIAVVW